MEVFGTRLINTAGHIAQGNVVRVVLLHSHRREGFVWGIGAMRERKRKALVKNYSHHHLLFQLASFSAFQWHPADLKFVQGV